MSVTHILDDLRQRNITVRAKGNNLSVIAGKGALSAEVRALLQTHKQEIVEYLQQLEEGESAGITVVDRSSKLPLSFGQQRLWFLSQLEPGSSAYVIPGAVSIEGPLDPASLAHALRQITQRHEVLRTVFVPEDGQPAPMILPEMEAPLSIIDLRQCPAETLDSEIEQRFREEMRRPFHLSTGTVLRGVMLRVAEERHVLLLTIHHIAA